MPKFYTLDAMRGVAALMVAALHFDLLPASSNPNLAVDFFFALSGFVIAYSYDAKLSAGMTDEQFVVRRVIRLYPIFVLGLVVGLVWAFARPAWAGSGGPTLPLTQFLATLFLLPFPAELSTGPEAPVAPLNGPYWSLILEIHINVLFAIFFRWLGMRLLSVLVALFGIGIVATAWTEGSLAAGFLTPTFYYGIVRVGFSFLAGVLLCRLRHRLWAPRLHWSVALAIVFGLLAAPTPESVRWIHNSVCVLVLFPLLILAGAKAQTRDARLQTIFAAIGAASYALYAIHGPIAEFAEEVGESWTLVPFRVWGLIFLLLTLAASFAAVSLYDEPVRRWLRARFQRGRRGELAAASVEG